MAWVRAGERSSCVKGPRAVAEARGPERWWGRITKSGIEAARPSEVRQRTVVGRYYIIIPPAVHASGSGLMSAPDGGAELSGPLSDVALDDPGRGASRCAVEPGTSSSCSFRHSAPPSERTGHPTWSAHVCMFQNGGFCRR